MRVFVCSPLRASADRTEEFNKFLAKKMCKLALERGYSPFAPHLLYTQFLDDSVESERDAGIKAGIDFLATCDEMWILVPPEGMTKGMVAEYEWTMDNKPSMTYKVFGLKGDQILPPDDEVAVS